MKRLKVLFASLVLAGALVGCGLLEMIAPPPASPIYNWTADLSGAHLGTVNFVAGFGDEWPVFPTPLFFRDAQVGRNSGDPCEVRYHPDMATFRWSLVEVYDSDKAYFDFASSLINCGLRLPENDNLRRRFEENPQPQAYTTWIEEYKTSCGASVFRLGWRFDPETDLDLACVPDFREVVERYIK